MDKDLKISRSEGITDAERYLKKLCDRSFLSMWSFVGVFNDKGTGQEVCDLLVVFDNHIIIFSDKDCEFPNTGDLELDWRRWYKKAIKKSADQIYGAERWILKYPDRLFLDQTCKIPFPINLPPTNKSKIHRILVAHSVSSKCVEILGGSGSLVINNDIVGDAKPFVIGKVEQGKDYVHVFDDTTLDILLNTLDTISDFIDYLEKKENFLNGDLKIFAAGEEELLTVYLKYTDEFGKHDFLLENKDLSKFGAIGFDQGFWTEFSQSLQRKAQIKANQISYFWDELIESFTKNFKEGTSHFNSHSELKDQEILLRLLAKEDRTRRRFLSEAFWDFVHKNNPLLKASRMLSPENDTDPYYVFLILPQSKDYTYEKYREVRLEMLYFHCLIAKLVFPRAKDIVGLATESGRKDKGSEDYIYFDARIWTDKDKKNAEKIRANLIRAKTFNPNTDLKKQNMNIHL